MVLLHILGEWKQSAEKFLPSRCVSLHPPPLLSAILPSLLLKPAPPGPLSQSSPGWSSCSHQCQDTSHLCFRKTAGCVLAPIMPFSLGPPGPLDAVFSRCLEDFALPAPLGSHSSAFSAAFWQSHTPQLASRTPLSSSLFSAPPSCPQRLEHPGTVPGRLPLSGSLAPGGPHASPGGPHASPGFRYHLHPDGF